MEHEPCLQTGKRSSITKVSGPDGLEAWFVALAACFINFVMAGLGRMSGILYVALIDIFQTDRRQAALPITIRTSTRNLMGPVVGILGQKYGVRPVIIAGGLISTVSAASCFYVNDILWMTVVWGGINGVGAALTTTLPLVVIGQHFKKYRSTASGMAFSGGCVGSFLFPVLMEHLLYTYGLGGTFLIIGGIIMHVIPAALILKKPSWMNDKGEEIQISPINTHLDETPYVVETHPLNPVRENDASFDDKDSISKKVESVPETNNIPNNISLYYEESSIREQSGKDKINIELLKKNRACVMKLLTNNFTLEYKPSETNQNNIYPSDDTFIKEIESFFCRLEANSSNDSDLANDSTASSMKPNNISEEKSTKSKTSHLLNGNNVSGEYAAEINLNPVNHISFHLQKLFERDRNDILQNFPEDEHENIHEILENLWHVHNLLENYNKKNYLCSHPPNSSVKFLTSNNNIEKRDEQSNTFCSHIKTAFKLHLKPLFLLICLCRSVHLLTFLPMVVTIVDFSMDKGLLAEDGKYVIAALSVGDLMGRLCFGWVTDKGYVTLPRYMLSVMVLQGAFTATLTLMQSRGAVMSSIAVFGLLQGSVFVRHPVLVSRYLGSHEQSIAMGCINFFSGILGLALPVYIGYFRDTIGSYNGMLYINGGVGAAVGLLWLFEPYLLKLSRSSPSRNETPV